MLANYLATAKLTVTLFCVCTETPDGCVLMDLCIAIMKLSSAKFRICLGQDVNSSSWRNSIQLCSYLLKCVNLSCVWCFDCYCNFRFDLFLYKTCLCLKCVPSESRTVYHIMVREMCGQFYYMCARYLYFEDNRTAFLSSSREYSFQVGLKLSWVGCTYVLCVCYRVNLGIYVYSFR